MDVPVWSNLTWPSWAWFDELFRDSEWRRPFKIEECKDEGFWFVRAELPGVDPDKDVEVQIVNDELVITAQKSESHEHKGRHEVRSEFRYGSMTRTVPVPKGVDESKISATYKDGVLEVRVPLPAGPAVEAPHRVAIKRA
jgi:HSP20 family protein